MPIVVDSSQWTGEYDDQPLVSPIVWGEFADQESVDRVADRLQAEEWFRRSRLEAEADGQQPVENDQVIAPDENPKGADRRNLRQNFVGTAAASTSMLAAGVVIATGGAALPAVAAAAAAGAATAAAGEAVGTSIPTTGSGNRPDSRDEAEEAKGPALGIPVNTDEERAQADAFLHGNGARRVWVQEKKAG
jgi:hypothetical protein